MRRALAVVLTLLLVAGALAGLAGLVVYGHVVRPGVAGENVGVTISEGMSGKDIAGVLQEKGLVEHALFFRLALKIEKTKRPIRAGTYDLPKGVSALQLVERMQQGPGAPHMMPPEARHTIPEGLSIAQAAETFANPKAYVEAASDVKLIAKLGLKAPTLEGFLMPDTYFFDKKHTERDVVERMVEQFQRKYADLTAQNPPPYGYDTLQVVTVASLVEEEAKIAEERPKIAAVIYNRLKKDMPLQMDSTLQYSLKKYGQRLTDEDKQVDSPYNTYKNKGLPPGPISSPGVSAIKAALRPAETNDLYFVSNADGKTHTFSENLNEHNKAVRNFRKEIAPQRQKARK